MIKIRVFLIGFLAVLLFTSSSAQDKPTINLETYKSWSKISGGGISNDGNFAYYSLNNKPIGSNTFIVKAIKDKWAKEFINVTNPVFTDNNQYLVGQLPNDTLFKLNLNTRRLEKLSDVQNYELIYKGESQVVLYLQKTQKKLMVIIGGKESQLASNVVKYTITPQRTSIVVQQTGSVAKESSVLSWIDFITGKIKTIYSGTEPSKIVFDDSESQLAFMAKNAEGYCLWYFRKNMTTSEIIADEKNEGITSKVRLYEHGYNFSRDGKSIFFNLQNSEIKNNNEDLSDLIISNYKDSYLQGESKRPVNNIYLSALNIETRKVIQLQNGKEEILGYSFKHQTDSLFVMQLVNGQYDDSFLKNRTFTYYLCNSRTGNRKIIEENKFTELDKCTISNNGKYIVYYDVEKQNYVNFVIATGEKIVITDKVHGPIIVSQIAEYAKPEIFPVGIIGWLKNDKCLLIQGSYDIWCVDALAKHDPINLTLGIGNKDKIVFNVIKELADGALDWNSELIASTFNTITKKFGFSKIRISKKPQITQLSSKSTYVDNLENLYFQIDPSQFFKAKNTNAFLLLSQTSTSAPNYYYSTNLREFKQISNNQPQKNYNWLSTELHNYSDSAGINYQGILYKPENFDASKKYPLIFHYYEKFSNTLNAFPTVELPPANFSIPMAVSNGYLVFLPDIISELNKPGEGALKSILTAACYLVKNEWVDSDKMAVAGHSFGGFETNYIITHSNIFKAAICGAGMSEVISIASDLWGEESFTSMQGYFRNSAPKMTHILSESPDVYIKNSPLLLGKNITTPLLLMHNQKDSAVPFRQSRQLFIMLRSLQKPVWWLNYRTETHGIGDQKNVYDYNKKVFDFLDHYLKGKPEATWMTDHL